MVHIQDDEEKETVNLTELKEHIRTAFEIQRKNGVYNSNLNPYELSERAKLDKDALDILDKWLEEHDVGERRGSNILKVALTIANIDGREIVSKQDVLEAILYSKTFELAAY